MKQFTNRFVNSIRMRVASSSNLNAITEEGKPGTEQEHRKTSESADPIADGLLSPVASNLSPPTPPPQPTARIFDFILCDNVMPNMDGPTAVRIMRDIGYPRPIFGTNYSDDQNAKHMKKLTSTLG
jgi:CheY-like chemotaxis protein